MIIVLRIVTGFTLPLLRCQRSFLDHSLLSAETAGVVPRSAIILHIGALHFHKASIRLKAGTSLNNTL